MTRSINDGIGKAGEKRIAKRLEDLGAEDVVLSDSHNGHPDITFTYAGRSFAAECKTMLPFYESRVGGCHLRRSEVWAMRSYTDEEGMSGLLIVELRPLNNKKLYFAVYWDEVVAEYRKTSPDVKSLSLYWILENGRKLEDVLSRFVRD